MDMNLEQHRLASFKGCRCTKNFFPSKFARAGFFVTENRNIVECFCCHLRIGGWESMVTCVDPKVVHRQRFPGCAFLDGAAGNVPYEFKFSELPEKAKNISRQFSDRSDDSTFLKKPPESPTSSSLEHGPIEPVPRGSDNTSIPPPTFNAGMKVEFGYKNEEMRLDSFKNWPTSTGMDPAELAQAGFYYTGSDDSVKCAFCDGIMKAWTPGDKAIEVHEGYFPQCSFVRNPISAGNIPISHEESNENPDQDVEGKEETGEQVEEYLLGIMTERAYHPHMATQTERRESFMNFKSNSNIATDKFAEAGFFFTGEGDNVKCFFCDGGLRNWERNDDPWSEHARWFPKCGYLNKEKGEKYVKEIRKRYAPRRVRKPRAKSMRQRYVVNIAELEAYMHSGDVRMVHGMGYPLPQIRVVVHRRFAEQGSPFPNWESLMDGLVEANELEHQSSDSENESDAEETAPPVCERNAYLQETDGTGAWDVYKGEVRIVFLKCGPLVFCGNSALAECPECEMSAKSGKLKVRFSWCFA